MASLELFLYLLLVKRELIIIKHINNNGVL